MSVGKSPKPLRILVLGSIEDWDEFSKLREQGHEMETFHEEVGYSAERGAIFDLILGPTCWFMDDAHRKYLPLAITEARRRRYPKEGKGE